MKFGPYLNASLVEFGDSGQLFSAVNVRVVALGERGFQLLQLLLRSTKSMRLNFDVTARPCLLYERAQSLSAPDANIRLRNRGQISIISIILSFRLMKLMRVCYIKTQNLLLGLQKKGAGSYLSEGGAMPPTGGSRASGCRRVVDVRIPEAAAVGSATDSDA